MTRRLADRYVLGEPLGTGGSARVHLAVDTRLDRRVAVKLLDSQMVATADPAARERFLREGRTTAAFNHRNAVTVFDAGEDDGDLFLVMELVDGPSLAALLARSGPLGIDQSVRIASRVLSALAAAHAVGIVHRDVKPANILLGPNGAVKLADFGIAKRFDDLSASVTSTGMVVGTPRYLSPEQARGEPATPASDVYSMAVVLFEMLTGRLPFDGETTMAVAVAQQSGPAPDVRSIRPEVSASLATVVARALALQPQARPATASEMLAELTAARINRPPTAAGPVRNPTQVMPATLVRGAERASPPTGAASQTDRSTSRTAILLFSAFLVVLGIVVVAAALSAGDDGGAASVDEPVTTAAAPQLVTSAAPTDVATTAATQPPTTTTTAPPTTTTTTSTSTTTTTTTTQPPTTTEPPATAPPVEEIIPGFPVTDDLEVFLAQLEDDPDLVGPSGEQLAERLEKVLEERGNERRQEAQGLRESLEQWVDADELSAPIAEALDDLLRPIARRGDDD